MLRILWMTRVSTQLRQDYLQQKVFIQCVTINDGESTLVTRERKENDIAIE